MEFLWSPWRFDYIAAAANPDRVCVFCVGNDPSTDPDRLVLARGSRNFIIMNLFPYTCGHVMVAPYRHLKRLEESSAEEKLEMLEMASCSIAALQAVYNPDGFNLGMNLGHAAGAGVRDHFHLHVVPRWNGDANFTTVVGETRVLPEDLKTTYGKLRSRFGV